MTSKGSSRWGSFLQQAVAGVESRLDNILADDDAIDSPSIRQAPSDSIEQPERKETLSIPATSRSASGRSNDRLQERLAKAVVNRSGSRPPPTISSNSSAVPSRTASPALRLDSSRSSIEIASPQAAPPPVGTATTRSEGRPTEKEDQDSQGNAVVLSATISPSPTVHDNSLSANQGAEQDISNPLAPSRTSPEEQSDITAGKDDESMIEAPLQQPDASKSEYSTSHVVHGGVPLEDDTGAYLERIDALQAKLQYLAKEAANIARKAANEAEAGSVEQRLAVKDEKIAFLMEEGQKLSQTELKYMNTIKKLRAKNAEDEKRISQSKRTAEDLARVAQAAQDRALRAEQAELAEAERVKALQKNQLDFEQLQIEHTLQISLNAQLREELAKLKDSKQGDENQKLKELLQNEKKALQDLKDDLVNAKIEKELLNKQHRTQVQEVQEKSRQTVDRAKMTEDSLQSEIKVLETRLEALRAHAEDSLSSVGGGTQAKLLRQIEVLQSQYSVATENWRGIEATLLTRITNLEQDRDESLRKETDIRRKAREGSNKVRRLEEELLQAKLLTDQSQLASDEQATRLATLQDQLVNAQQQAHDSSVEQGYLKDTIKRLEEQLGEVNQSTRETKSLSPEAFRGNSFFESTPFSPRAKIGNDRVSPNGQRQPIRPTLGIAAPSHTDRHPNRRTSAQNLQPSGDSTPYRHDSMQSFHSTAVNKQTPDTPSIRTEQFEDYLDGGIAPATPEGRTINDMISVSTAAAGPSVQVVERLSAAVRRLESEKAASQEEFDRLLAQRDEARQQVVSYMQEAEQKKAADAKVQSLEDEIIKLNQRYQTTLEMLGEKSELVEELRADVADVKQMYRDLVENTIR
ncbi:hypothetical protein MMC25_008026 [Agyrium rufum]|nr:hypothetical protein [Agyrium rufum]